MTDKLKRFYFGAILFSWCSWIPFGASQAGLIDIQIPWEIVLLGQFGPSLMAIMFVYFFGGAKQLKAFFNKSLNFHIKIKWFIIPLVTTPLIGLLCLLFSSIIGISIPTLYDFIHWPMAYAEDYGSGGPYTLQGELVYNLGLINYIKSIVLKGPLAAVMVFILLTLITGPISEEFGWRGFVLPRLLSEKTQLKSSIILGLLWGFWHTGPDFWTFVFEAKIYAIIYPIAIVMGTIPLSILFTSLYVQTKGSLIPIMIFHASFNGTLYIFTLVWESQSFFITSAELIAGLWILSFFIIWKNKEFRIQRNV